MDPDRTRLYLLIVAAGRGRRMGHDRNKLLLPLAGRPLLAWTLEAALAAPSLVWLGLVGQEVDRAEILGLLEPLQPRVPVVWIQGGDTRQESVARGLEALPDGADQVLIHDGARCLAGSDLFERCAAALRRDGVALIAATPVTDTIKQVDGDGRIRATPDRASLWAAQTPQGFPVAELRRAHRQAREAGWEVTDDAALFERLGLPVRVLDAGPGNLKVTAPLDLELASALLRRRQGAGN
jgi:2-C-methyl-D-erythritol 4-phosphate cytidylyltransferase